MNAALVLTFAATAALVGYGLWSWQRIITRRREADPGTS